MHNGINNRFSPGLTRWVNVDLASLIEQTYRLKDYQLEGGPAWFKSDRWDIEGKAAGPANSREMSVMMRALLADRFQLRFHFETKQRPVYHLTVAKGGPKLVTAHPQDENHHWGTTAGTGLLIMNGTTIESFTWWLSGQLNQPVVDETGLTGTYDLKVEWKDDADISDDPTKPSIFTAVRDRLGLELRATKGPVEVFVIDHVERATAN
jgi:uncharacterized protein (TIGR03435 family)